MLRLLLSIACYAALALIAPDAGAAQPSAAELPRIRELRDRADWAGALAAIYAALVRNPGDPDLFRLEVITLSDNHDADRAYALYRTRSDLFTGGEKLIFDARWYARRISNTIAGPSSPADAESLLGEIDRYVASVQASGRDVPPSLPLDRVLLLAHLQRHAEVVAQYVRWRDAGKAVPAYVRTTVADSYMTLRRPADAEKVLRELISSDPDNEALNSQLGYALIEQERVDEGIAHLHQRLSLSSAGRASAERSYAFAQGFSKNVPEALAHIEPMVAATPQDAGLQSLLATLYRYRGESGRALAGYRLAESLDPTAIDPRLGQIAALGDLQRPELARPILDRLSAEYPLSPRVRRAREAWEAGRSWNGRVYAAAGKSDAETSPLGSRESRVGLQVATPLLGDRWRVLAREDSREAEFRGARIRDTRTGLGLSYAFGDVNADLLAAHSRDELGPVAVSVATRYRAGDHLVFRAGLSRNDAGASLQARAAGITADGAHVAAEYRWTERTSASVGVERWRYDDGNVRDVLTGAFVQRVVSRPHLTAEAVSIVYASSSTRRDAPYFNPTRDGSAEVTLRATQVVSRHYERSVRQRFSATLGGYWQQGFGSALVPSLRYERIWQFDESHAFQVGLAWSRPVYDGQRERHFGIDAEYRWGR